MRVCRVVRVGLRRVRKETQRARARRHLPPGVREGRERRARGACGAGGEDYPHLRPTGRPERIARESGAAV